MFLLKILNYKNYEILITYIFNISLWSFITLIYYLYYFQFETIQDLIMRYLSRRIIKNNKILIICIYNRGNIIAN